VQIEDFSVKEKTRFSRQDWVLVCVLFLVGLVLRVPFRAQLAYHWDGVEFAMAINKYDVTASQPHAPGYFLYVMLGRVVNLFVGDPHASLVWLSVAFGSVLAGLMYWMGVAMFGRRTGLVAALFAMTSPQIWFHSEVALTYVVDAFWVSLTAFWCWRTVVNGGSWRDVVIIGVLVAIVGGVRQQSVPPLAVLVAFCAWKFNTRRLLKLLVTAGVALALGLAWFVPMVSLSGGLPLYLQEVRRHTAFNAPATLVGGGWDAFTWNVFFAALFCWNGLILGAVLLVAGVVHRAMCMTAIRRGEWNNKHGHAMSVLAMWVLPFVISGTVGFTKQAGYVLSYLPGLIMLAAVVAAHVRGSTKFALVTAVVCAVNIVAFACWPKDWDGVFFGTGLTARRIREHDRRMGELVTLIRQKYDPGDTIICHATGHLFFGLRLFQYYLPEFDQIQFRPDPAMLHSEERPFLAVKGGELTFVAADFINTGKVLLVVPVGQTLVFFEPYVDLAHVEIVSGSGGQLFLSPARAVF
jgi:hypothetical protein